MELDKKNYTTIRAFKEKGWSGNLSKYPEVTTLTYLYDSEEEKEFPDGALDLDSSMLMRGTLFHWRGLFISGNPGSEDRKGFLRDLLEDLQRVLEYPSLQEMIIHTNIVMSNRSGVEPAFEILEAGRELLPNNTALEAHMVLAQWMGVELGGQRPLGVSLRSLVRRYESLDLTLIRPEDLEWLDYAYLTSLYLLKQHKKWKRCFWRTLGKRFTSRRVIERVSRMLEDPGIPVEDLIFLNYVEPSNREEKKAR